MNQSIPRTWVLAETDYETVLNANYQVAVLPLGATEPHNTHLPYGTDIFEASAIGEHVCQAANDRGAKVVLLPSVPFGVQTNMQALPLAININPSTLNLFLTDIVRSVRKSGIEKIVLLNSHGGNELKPFMREMAGEGIPLFLIDWFKVLNDVYHQLFEHREDHAGEMETSIALAYFPNLVRKREDGSLHADDGSVRSNRFEAVNRGWVSITRPWHLLTTQTGSGNPHAASEAKGKRCMDLLVERLAPFLVELSNSYIDDTFPFQSEK
jgi:creatinine amidohydrolase